MNPTTVAQGYREGTIDATLLKWHDDKRCLEISAGGMSIVIEGIDIDFAEAFANELKMQLLTTREIYSRPDVQPQVMLERDVILKLWKYPAHPDNQ
jgi:hypothetical protein